ncbi:hypothetical protein L1987_26400 [Smallanthus sonchifolius]|uniref:Uncharacterized protein n=1 Tax=Smallanthus sonchifolius TaxID=185202 RepID=A0ACB9IB09_9ASTR|nr:hypothetical protein L1987_26400 [Smallanthus sonchifolius]
MKYDGFEEQRTNPCEFGSVFGRKAEGSSAEPIATLAKDDTSRQKMEAAYETLQVDQGYVLYIPGSDQTISDFTYAENVAHALICAEATLTTRMLIVSGKSADRHQISCCGCTVDCFSHKMDGFKYNSRDLKHVSVHNTVQILSHTTTYNCFAAERHIQYPPIVSLGVSF